MAYTSQMSEKRASKRKIWYFTQNAIYVFPYDKSVFTIQNEHYVSLQSSNDLNKDTETQK